MAKVDSLIKILDGLRASMPELRGVMLASTEGLPIAHSMQNAGEPNRVAAMAAASVVIGRKVTDNVPVGPLQEIIITGQEGQVFLYSVGRKAILAVLAPAHANAGLVNLEARGTAEELSNLLDRPRAQEATA